jgi:multidrug efflux pump subunit AcrA (membrane-fusion protein)
VYVNPIQAPISEAIFASGHIEPVNQVVLTSSVEGYLRFVHVKENDLVEEGEALFSIDDRMSSIDVSSARKDLELAYKKSQPGSPALTKLMNDLKSSRQRLMIDSANYARMQALFKTQSVSQTDLDNARLAYEVSVNNANAIQDNIEATHISLQQELIHARQQFETSAVIDSNYNVRAIHAGRIYQLLKREGELVRKGEAIGIIGHRDSLAVILLIDETGIRKVRKGQLVLIELNTHRGKVMKARVSNISPYFNNDTQSYRVEAFFETMPDDAIAGTMLQANVVVGKKESAMLIPRSCLIQDGKVIVRQKSSLDTVTVETGVISTEWVEVVNGLSLNDEVLKKD